MPRPSRKTEIADAARKVFARKGILSATVRDVAKEAGVTDAAIYRHWENKAHMAKELFMESLESWTRGATVPDGMPAEEAVKAMVDGVFDHFSAHPVECRFVLAAQYGFPDEEYLEAGENPFDIAAGRLFRDLPEQASQAMAGAVVGVVNQLLSIVVSGRIPLSVARETARTACAAIVSAGGAK